MVTIPELPNIDGGAGAPENDGAGPQDADVNCDSTGTCYDGKRACGEAVIVGESCRNPQQTDLE